MHLLEITVREPVPPFGVLGLLVVDPEVPPGVLGEPVLLDVAVLLSCRRLMFAPVVPVVEHVPARLDEGLGVLERLLVQLHRHVLQPPHLRGPTRLHRRGWSRGSRTPPRNRSGRRPPP